MTVIGWLQIAFYFVVSPRSSCRSAASWRACSRGSARFFRPVLRPVEIVMYRIAGVDETREQHAVTYTVGHAALQCGRISRSSMAAAAAGVLPLNPAEQSAVASDLSFNTAVSFATNTNWQNYGGESTMSYLTQMIGLTIRTSSRPPPASRWPSRSSAPSRGARCSTVGNFWVDVTRCTLYVLLPLSVIAALVLVWQGVPQNLGAYVDATTLEGAKQTLSQGPAASQIAIKQLGTNGGGFWNANSAVPYENPTAADQLRRDDLHSAHLGGVDPHVRPHGRATTPGLGDLAAMSIIFLGALLVCYWAEAHGNPNFAALGIDPANMEGKEVRFGIANSSLWATATTAASNGSVNSMHDSFTPIGGMIPLMGMIALGEIIYGGVGSGLYGMLLYVILAIFIAGLMVGRTPEYVGKKIEAKEVKMAMLAILILPLSLLGWTAVAMLIPSAVASTNNPGRMASPKSSTPTLADRQQWLGIRGTRRQHAILQHQRRPCDGCRPVSRDHPDMVIAGSLVVKKTIPASSGTFPTPGGLFVGLVVGVILIVGGLTYFPALSLGPIVEQLAINAGTLFSSN